MGNFFSDFAGGLVGEGPGTDTISGYEARGTVGRQGEDRLRAFLDTGGDPAQGGQRFSGGFGSFFAPYYEALPSAEREERVTELGNVYKAQFNPFLQDVFTRAEGELSKSGLLTSGRASYLKGKLGSDLALQSMLPTVQYKHQMMDTNRAETLRNRMMILDRALGNTTPESVEVAKPSSFERGLGALAGKAAGTWATGGFSASGTPFGFGGGASTTASVPMGDTSFMGPRSSGYGMRF